MVEGKSIGLFTGRIGRILSSKNAEIAFIINDTPQKAFLAKEIYFYNAKSIPSEEPFNKYISVNMEVDFICHIIRLNGKSKWVAIMCWPTKHTLGDNIDIKAGMICVPGHIFILKDNQGILTVDNYDEQQLEVFFTFNKFFLHGKKLSSCPKLVHHLNVKNTVYFDAIPCIRKENKYNCEWIATCVYVGQKPIKKEIMFESTNKVATDILQIIQNCFKNPQCIFIIGKGKFFKSIDNDCGLILAQFQDNIFKEILFHKKSLYVFNMCLAKEKLSDILKKGDKLNFIAIGTPINFFVNWVAVQVSVCDYGE